MSSAKKVAVANNKLTKAGKRWSILFPARFLTSRGFFEITTLAFGSSGVEFAIRLQRRLASTLPAI
jgi:hypothetical protein